MVTKEQAMAKLEEIVARREELWLKEAFTLTESDEIIAEHQALSIWEDVLDWVLEN